LRRLLDSVGYEAVQVVAVPNTYFGGNIKVAGLLTGKDLAEALVTIPESTVCLVPDVCLSEGRFLDGSTVEDLPRSISVVATTGSDLRATLDSFLSRRLVGA
jgi:hypothetical protein